MGPRVKQYLLFMFGNWSMIEKNAEVVNNIRDVMETIVTEEEFTFITGDHVIIMCVKSRLSFEEIEDVLKEFLSPFINTLFLMPKPRKLYYRMDENLKNHLFGKRKPKYKHIDPKVAEILKISNFKETKLIPMTIDGLLDKILDEGIDSLTIEEKEFLNKFNK